MELLGLKFSPFSFCPLLFDIQQGFPLFKAFTPAIVASQPTIQWISEAFLGKKYVQWRNQERVAVIISTPLYAFMMRTGTNLPWSLGPNTFSNAFFPSVLILCNNFPYIRVSTALTTKMMMMMMIILLLLLIIIIIMRVLGAVAKLQKFLLASSYLSVPLDVFSRNEDSYKICGKKKSFIKIWQKNTATLHEYLRTFMSTFNTRITMADYNNR